MSCFDAATPGTGPLGFSHAPMPSLDFEKFNDSFNLSRNFSHHLEIFGY
jgi:hypothetical protein